MSWPNNSDGDVFRRLKDVGFDFNAEHEIEFNIDFNSWPLKQEVINRILFLYPNCEFVDPDEDDLLAGVEFGFVQFKVVAKLTYELVVNTQSEATKNVNEFGGICESWGTYS